jgi:hypothetical protein
VTTYIPGLNAPVDLAFDSAGVTYINEWSGNRILKMDRKGIKGQAGNLFVAETGAGRILKMTGDF